jgi:hypothetical protein
MPQITGNITVCMTDFLVVSHMWQKIIYWQE